MSFTALPVVSPGQPLKATSWGNVVRAQLLGLGSGEFLGPLNLSRSYRALSTAYVLPDDYGRMRVDWDKVGSGWLVFALFEVITDNASGTVRVEIVDLAGPTQVVEMAATANPTTWTLQGSLAIPVSTGVKYYTARVKGGDAAIGVGVVGGGYLAIP